MDAASTSSSQPEYDIALVGGGLASGLIALALAEKRPDLRVCIIEPEAKLGGNHVWSFFDADVAADHRWLVDPLIVHRWADYDVHFPQYSRTLDMAYNSIESERLDAVVRSKIDAGQIVSGRAVDVSASHVLLDNQQRITARTIIDARGPGDMATLDLGWQKFVGQTLTVPAGHRLTRPIIIDATVLQIDGYRFVYCLPFSDTEVFVEDTYYSDGSDLDVPAVRTRIADYAAAKGWAVSSTDREESGVLPVAMGGDFDAYWASTGADVAKAGLRAGLFHPTTGYSLPDAVRLAIDMIANPFPTPAESYTRAKAAWEKRGFYCMLDKLLFRAGEPDLRYKVLQRHYSLSPRLIARFYAGQSTPLEKLRMLAGKPPVPFWNAVRVLLQK
jgi:lycopene beta-cyclase